MTDRVGLRVPRVLLALLLTATAAAAQAPATADGDKPTAAHTGPKVVEEGLFPKSVEFKTSSIPVDGSAAAEQSGRTTIDAREAGFVRYGRGAGHVQVAGLLRQLRHDAAWQPQRPGRRPHAGWLRNTRLEYVAAVRASR